MPGVLRMLADVHAEHGETPWRDLLAPATTLADNGFAIQSRLAAAIAKDAGRSLAVDPDAAAYFLNPDRSPKAAGSYLTNPAYAKTLGAVASDPRAFYTGSIAAGIVEAVAETSGGRTPGAMTVADLANYRSVRREPVCVSYRDKQVCGMPRRPRAVSRSRRSSVCWEPLIWPSTVPPTSAETAGGQRFRVCTW